MINKLLKGFVDLTYGVNRIKDEYLNDNPTEKVLAADGSKGILTDKNKDVERGLDWVTSQRAVVLLTDKKVKSGQWNIELDNIESAQLVLVNSLYGKGQILKISTIDNKHYQFGMQFSPEWTNQNVLPLTIEEGKIKTSTFSLVIRLLLIVFILYKLLEKIGLI